MHLQISANKHDIIILSSFYTVKVYVNLQIHFPGWSGRSGRSGKILAQQVVVLGHGSFTSADFTVEELPRDLMGNQCCGLNTLEQTLDYHIYITKLLCFRAVLLCCFESYVDST